MEAPAQKSIKQRTQEMISSDPDIKRWVLNLRSDSTKRIYSESLLRFSEYANKTPKEIVQSFQADKKAAEDLLTDFILSLRNQFTPKSVHNHLVAAKSWLLHNDIEVRRKIYCGNTKTAPTIENESQPSPEELNRILEHADLRGKTFVSLIAFSGLRPKTSSGITLRDLPELVIDGENTRFSKMPTTIKVKAELSKNGRPYFTFLSTQGCEYLLEYLKTRIREGERLTLDSKVLTYSKLATTHNLSRKGFSKKIKRTFIKAGFNGRAYILRSYFDTALANSRMSEVYQQFLMGHSGNMEAIYVVNKKLPDYVVNEMRQQYTELAEPKLQTISLIAKNEVDKLKAEISKKDGELEAIKVRMQTLELSKPTLEALLKKVEQLENKLNKR